MSETVWMRPPDGGAPKEVAATPEELTPLMAAGWTQCLPARSAQAGEPPEAARTEEEVTEDAR